MLKNKALIIIVTRNNSVLLEHSLKSFEKYNAGYDCDFIIVDHESTDIKHKKTLDKISSKYNVVIKENNRVETSFNKVWLENKDYKYYLFLHDDSSANKDNWLKVFIDRVNSNYTEDIIKKTEFANLPIGKVGAQSQYWRSYSAILGYPIQCLFLKEIVDLIRSKTPSIFKYTDCDRVLITNKCLRASSGVRSVADFIEHEKYEELCIILNKYLQYSDEGIPPKNIYPPGKCWNKFCLTAELLNSIDPLINGYRTVSLEGDGFLENIHGYDELWGHHYIHHYGAPNFKQAIAKYLNTDPNEIPKHLNNKVFLMKCDKIVKQYFEE